jgi:CheY-like chemotaxis protein
MDSTDPAGAENGDLLAEELRMRIRALEADLERHIHAEEQFARIVNELNNLLAVMRGHAQLTQESPTPSTGQELARIVLASTARAQEIVKRVLTQSSLRTEVTEKLKDSVRASRAGVLVVDDDESMRFLMHQLLTKCGHDVTVAENGRKALEEAGRTVFDVALLDIILGDMNGVEVFRELRRISPTTRVVFLSGDPSIEQVRKTVRDEGADGFITKPFDIYELERLVAYLVKRAPASAQT